MDETTEKILQAVGAQIASTVKGMAKISQPPMNEKMDSLSRLVNSYSRLFALSIGEKPDSTGRGDRDYLDSLREI